VEKGLIRVLVIDDSAYNRRILSEIINSCGFAQVVGIARDGEEGLKKAFELRPDLITLDLEMPHMDGFTFLRILMKSLPTPVVVVSSLSEDRNVFKALELGAIEFVAKPDNKSASQEEFQRELLQKISFTNEIRMRNIQRRISQQSAMKMGEVSEPHLRVVPVEVPKKVELIAIGASTGGPSAIQSILTQLPEDLGAGIAIAQHMPPGFTRAFAERLNRTCKLEVKEAEMGDELAPGRVLVAPGGKNLLLRKRRGKVIAILEDKSEADKYIPSIDKLFLSGADIFGPRMIAVVLTGMGSDGKEGAEAVKLNGGIVFTESEKTSIVFGMPREVINSGIPDKVLNLEEIAKEILKYC